MIRPPLRRPRPSRLRGGLPDVECAGQVDADDAVERRRHRSRRPSSSRPRPRSSRRCRARRDRPGSADDRARRPRCASTRRPRRSRRARPWPRAPSTNACAVAGRRRDVVDRDGCALVGERLHHAAADAARTRGAGDEGDLALRVASGGRPPRRPRLVVARLGAREHLGGGSLPERVLEVHLAERAVVREDLEVDPARVRARRRARRRCPRRSMIPSPGSTRSKSLRVTSRQSQMWIDGEMRLPYLTVSAITLSVSCRW